MSVKPVQSNAQIEIYPGMLFFSVAGNFPLNSLQTENGLALERLEKCPADVCEGAADMSTCHTVFPASAV